MKKIIVTLFAFFSVTPFIYSQTNLQLMTYIKKLRWETISSLSNYQKTTELRDTFGFRNVYMKGKELRLVSIQSIENNKDKRVSWYFNNGQFTYGEQLWIDSETNNIVNHEKSYVNNGHLITWIKTDGSTVNPASDEFKNLEKELITYTNLDLKGYSK